VSGALQHGTAEQRVQSSSAAACENLQIVMSDYTSWFQGRGFRFHPEKHTLIGSGGSLEVELAQFGSRSKYDPSCHGLVSVTERQRPMPPRR
jgi:hypothetical protein